MNKKYILVFVIIVLFLAIGFNMRGGSDVIENISASELKEMLSKDYQFLDIRTKGEYVGTDGPVHIDEFNLNIDYYKFQDDYSMLSDLDKEKELVIICNSGNRSASAALIFKALGFKKVYNVTNGIKNWYD